MEARAQYALPVDVLGVEELRSTTLSNIALAARASDKVAERRRQRRLKPSECRLENARFGYSRVLSRRGRQRSQARARLCHWACLAAT